MQEVAVEKREGGGEGRSDRGGGRVKERKGGRDEQRKVK